MHLGFQRKSSTESELVGVDDASAQILWTNYFIESQGYVIDETEVFQDNLSATLLEINGRESSGRRTKHINVRYFFIKDRVASGEVTIMYCPTEMMLADPFAKSLQGAAFRKFRALIMNIDESIPDCEMSWDRADMLIREIWADLRPQECVGIDSKRVEVPRGTYSAAVRAGG